jgi:transaldolase/glucose-6-phosphate isomerase
LFAQEVYEKVAEAYIAGLEQLSATGGDISKMASVASFFISRIDTLVDSKVNEKLKAKPDAQQEALLKGILGKVAIANGKLTYQKYLQIFSGPRWEKLAARGAQTQRVLWASTSTKNPAYRDVIYVEELIGKDTVNTVPPATLDAFREHGRVRESLTENIESAKQTMSDLAKVGISMKEVTDQLTVEGVKLFADAFDKLLEAVEKSTRNEVSPKVNKQNFKLPPDLASSVKTHIDDWRANGKVRRLWQRDASLWTNTDEAKWLGWLGVTEEQTARLRDFRQLAEDVKSAGFTHVLLLGMGGSSLCPEVLKMTFGKLTAFPELHVLDSTDPAQVKSFENRIDLSRTLFIVSSKSGSTLEPNIFKQYFFERAKEVAGPGKAGSQFIAITDPGSKMEQVARSDHFRHIFHGLASIGGRYSALSDFGVIPALAMGLDVAKFLDRTEDMVQACASSVPVEENPGAVLGVVLGAAHNLGRDKVTIITSPGISDLGAWLEQLLAESTGKDGKGIIPVDREQVGEPEVYGKDRLFVYLRLETAPDAAQDTKVTALENSGQPVVRISLGDTYDLGQEFFRWEIATAVAGSIIGINPFNQPDVEASKIATRNLTSEYEKTGALPEERPLIDRDGIKLFTDTKNAEALAKAAGNDQSLVGFLRAHLNRMQAGDYFALLAYLQMNGANEDKLQAIRHMLRDSKRVATCLGFGPRFLHSTGQAYKGGPDSGVFLQITCDDAVDLPIPGQRYTFGIVKAAQARGDFQVLAERNRRALRVHLGEDVQKGLVTLQSAIKQVLG